MADIKETVPFNYDDLYAGLKKKFQDAGYDTEEGSNTSQLITAMTYLTSMLNVNTAVNINETLLPLSTKRKNALEAARALGYESAHKQSYKYRLTINFAAAGTYTIPKYTEFVCEGRSYFYMGTQLDLEFTEPNSIIHIDVKEGTLYKFSENESLSVSTETITESDGSTRPQYFIDIPYVAVERDGLEVYLTYYDDNGILVSQEKWHESAQFMIDSDTTLKNEYIRLDNIDFDTPRIYFKYANVGIDIRVGTIVEMNVLTTSGAEGKIANLTKPSEIKHKLPGAEITVIDLILEGTDDEELSSIKENAAMFHNSANRAVTKQDYVAFCNRHQAVQTSMVWGGDDEYPKSPGHVWFSFLPSTYTRNYTPIDTFNNGFTLDMQEDISNWYVEDFEIRSVEYTDAGQLIKPGIWDTLDNYKIITLEYHNRHPIYLNFDYNLDILKYDIKTSKADIHKSVFDVIDRYFDGSNQREQEMEDFEIEYFHSSLIKRIDTELTDITGFNNTVSTEIMLTSKNVSNENTFPQYRDIYIPLATPFEEYFNESNELIETMLPSIDTSNFISELGIKIYTDWSDVNSISGNSEIIFAPIRGEIKESIVGTAAQTVFTFSDIKIQPDDVTDDVPTHDLISVKINGGLVDPADYTIDTISQITLSTGVVDGDIVEVTVNNQLGVYYLFNSYKKFIMIQLYIDATGYNPGDSGDSGDSGENLYTEPKSYLTTSDGFYEFTESIHYLTTNGYVINTASAADAITGTIARTMIPEFYSTSPLTAEMFDTVRYLNFNYVSPNFKVLRNMIPRLRSVNFN